MKSKKHQVVIRNINVYLNKEQEKVWSELPELYTHNQRVQHFINYYIGNERKKIMEKTVKELIELNIDEETGWFNQEINYYDLLTDILQAHENEITEKDKEIDELKLKQLYQEDFVKKLVKNEFNDDNITIFFKDNSKYDKLPSKEDQHD